MLIKFDGIKIQLLILLIYPAGIISAKIMNCHFSSNPYFFLFLFFISHYLILFIILFYKLKESCSKKDNDKTEENIKNKNDEIDSEKFQELSEINDDLNLTETIRKIDVTHFVEINNKKEKILRILFIGILYFIVYVFFYYSNYINTTGFYGNISMIIINFIENKELELNFLKNILYPTLSNFIAYLIFCYHLVKAKYFIEKFHINF